MRACPSRGAEPATLSSISVGGSSVSPSTIFQAATYFIRGAGHMDHHTPVLRRVVTQDYGGGIICIEPLEIVPVHGLDSDFSENGM